jgi:hypothetical protein
MMADLALVVDLALIWQIGRWAHALRVLLQWMDLICASSISGRGKAEEKS